ncbi:MAG: LolA family protein [Planctomycetota bacterium]|jgi:hypothetical protein
MDRKVHDGISQALEEWEQTRESPIRHNIGRIIMKSRISKLAAVGTFIVIAALGITFLDNSAAPAYAVGQTLEALSDVKSVHIVARGWDDELMEMWMEINPETGRPDNTYLDSPFVYEGETYQFAIVSTPDVSYQYNKTENVVKVFERQLIESVAFDRIFESIAERLRENQKMEVYYGKEPESGKSVIVLLVEGEDKLLKFLIDPQTKLPISIETFGPQKTDLRRTESITYNEPIPAGIFDFEIPEGAEVINISEIEAMLDRPDAGMPADNLTNKQASLLVAKEYWQALINEDWSAVERLRPIRSARQWYENERDNPAVELLEVGQAYWQKGCSEPVTPCIVKYKDGSILEIKTYPRFREIDGEKTCVIGGVYGCPKQIEQGQ